MSAALILRLIPGAMSAEVLLHAEASDAAALSDATRLLEVPADSLVPLRLRDMLDAAAPVFVEGTGTVEGCVVAPLSPAGLHDALKRGRSALAYMQFDDAAELLDPRRLACLTAIVDPEPAAQLAYLHGVVVYELGDMAATEASFNLALSLDPGLVWDAGLPPRAQDLFAARKNAAASATLDVTAGVVVDGRSAGRALVPGRHLVQSEDGTGFFVEIGEGRSVLLLPDALDASMLGWTRDRRAPLLAAAVDAWVGGDRQTVVLHDGVVWQRDGDRWTEHRPRTTANSGVARVVPDEAMRRRRWITAGVGMTSAGIVTVGYGLLRMYQSVDDATEAIDEQEPSEYDDAVDVYRSSYFIMGTGGAIAGLGLTTTIIGVTIAATPTPTGLRVSGRF